MASSTNATRLLTDLAGAFGVPLLLRRIPKEVKVRDVANLDAPGRPGLPGGAGGDHVPGAGPEEVLATIGRESALVEAVS